MGKKYFLPPPPFSHFYLLLLLPFPFLLPIFPPHHSLSPSSFLFMMMIIIFCSPECFFSLFFSHFLDKVWSSFFFLLRTIKFYSFTQKDLSLSLFSRTSVSPILFCFDKRSEPRILMPVIARWQKNLTPPPSSSAPSKPSSVLSCS